MYYIASLLIITISARLDPGYSQEAGKSYIKNAVPTGAGGALPRETVQYYDGLGRPVQTVQKGASPNSTTGAPVDLADYQEYDSNGRPYRNWLLVPVPAGVGHSSGESVSLTDVSSNGNTPYANDGVRYSETVYDGSPLDIIRTEYGPGAAWKTADKGKRASRLTNDTSGGRLTCKRTVLIWTGNTTFELGAPSVVPAASLNVQSVTDEDGRESLTFTDLYGRTVLERSVDTTAVSQNYRFLDTWYIYDKLGRLEAVFQPELSAALAALSNPTASQLAAMPVDEFAYFYRYDARGRCIAKKLPGCGWVYQIYDKGDRPVLTQDAEQRKLGQWTFSLQDALSRVCVTGTCSGNWNAFADPLGTIQIKADYEGASGTLMGYTATGITLTNADISSVSYYDEYGFITSLVPFAKRAMLTYQTPVSSCDGQYATSALGLETGTAVKVFGKEGESLYLYTALYYDAKGRPVQERKTDHLGGGQFSQVGYAFTGEPLHRRIEHGFANGTSMTEDYSYTYDGWGRLLYTGHTLGSGTEVTLSSNTYDSVGRLSRTDRGSNTSAATTYSYNVRSWLTGQTGPYSESLAYNTTDDVGNNTLQWGGNISARQWSVSGDVVAHRYAFEYDGVSRLSSASYSGFTGADYSCTYTYDRNSNIKTQVRKGLFANGTYGIIDNNTYVYNGNQLVGVSNSIQCTYDDNGRLTSDGLNSINAITYNRLNLPETMDFTVQPLSPRSIRNWYSAYGTKLRTEWRTANDTIPKDYVGNLVFVNDTLRTVLVDGGYIDVSYPSSSPQYSYRWFLADHQGSNRATINASGNIVQATHYYPFGPEMKLAIMFDGGPADNVVEQTGYLYKFSGKEQIPQSSLGWYDFGARWYDPIHARWTTPDPLAEKYYAISPYVYCAGNPVNVVDPDGKRIDDYYSSLNGKYLGSDICGTTSRLIDPELYYSITNGKQSIKVLDSSDKLRENSKVITSESIEEDAQRVTDASRQDKLEHQVYIVLDRENARIYAVDGPVGSNDRSSIDYYPGKLTGASFYDHPGGPIIIGQIHGHPESTDINKHTLQTMSDYDINTAIDMQIPIFATDAMSGRNGSAAGIHVAMPSGEVKNSIGTTPGLGNTSYIPRLGLMALSIWGKSGYPN